jgi:hypothetical protein
VDLVARSVPLFLHRRIARRSRCIDVSRTCHEACRAFTHAEKADSRGGIRESIVDRARYEINEPDEWKRHPECTCALKMALPCLGDIER